MPFVDIPAFFACFRDEECGLVLMYLQCKVVFNASFGVGRVQKC